MKRLHGLALLALSGCSPPSRELGTALPTPYVVRGTVSVRDMPANSRLVVVWLVKNDRPALIKFGEASPTEPTYELVFSTNPPARAIEPSGVAVGLTVLLDDRVEVAADGDDFDATSLEPHVLGSAEFEKVIWRGPGVGPVPAWAQAFPMGYSCGRCDSNKEGERGETFVPARCDVAVTADSHPDSCSVRPKPHRPGESRSWLWPFPRGAGLALVGAGLLAITSAPALVVRVARRKRHEDGERRSSLRRMYEPMLLVLAFAALWFLVAALSPATMRWLQIHHAQKPAEGPFELVQELSLIVCALAWIHIAWRSIRRWPSFALAACMALQVAVLFGEETNWGADVGWHPLGDLNLRMMIRHAGWLGPGPDGLVITAYLLLFAGTPLIPLPVVQRWLDRVAPVRARLGDSLALLAVPVAWMFLGGVLGARPVIEFVQMSVYLVLYAITLRVWRESRAARARPGGQ